MDAARTLRLLKTLPTQYSIMLRAKHGVGKSSLVKQAAQELGIQFHDVRLSQCEVGDIKGLPFLDEENGRTKFAKPYWWPRDPESKGILFFDELNRASKDVLQAVFEICLDKRLDGEALPKGWKVVSAINADDDYDVVELDPALLDRWFVIDFDPTPKEWISWATKAKISEQVVEFIRANPELLDPKPGRMESGTVYPSRRSWVALDGTIQEMNLLSEKDGGYFVQVVKGWVGSAVAAAFQKFVQSEFSRLKASDVLDNWEEICSRVEDACADIESISTLANSVMTEVSKRSAKEFGKQQQDNLKAFFILLPSEVASSIWKELLKNKNTRKIVSTEWQADPEFDKKIEKIFRL